MRLIDADVIKIPKGFFEKVDNVPKFYDWLDDQPTVDPVKHGRWIVVSDGYGNGDATAHICECSECKDTIWVYKKATRRWNYCPNCGAKMDTEEGEAHEQN